MTITDAPHSGIPSAAQLAETRLKQWHQTGEALLTIENLRAWINAVGLVLFAPKPQIASPAPSLVEAVLGAPNPSPTPAQVAEANSLLGRIVAEGFAVPLSLLGMATGTVSDAPDYLVSTAVFSYVFTLRGDKAWKQPPSDTGANKVSPLALAAYEALERRGPLSARDLATEVGKEITEAAVLRALGELWTRLRVFPLTQADSKATLWELASTRFTKQIKAGVNAGQPSALSALISLYLGQALVATEDEIESFLSPLAPRSRVRDVIHALLAARELETIAVEGRTMLHVTGGLPVFAAAEVMPEPETAVEVTATGDVAEDKQRITTFVAKPRKVGTGYLAKAKPAKFAERSAGDRKTGGFKRVTGDAPRPDRERRPFSKPGTGGFDKPWNEERGRRLAAARKPSEVPEDTTSLPSGGISPRGARFSKPRTDRPEWRGGDRERSAAKPAFGTRRAFEGKGRFDSEDRPPRREFVPRADGAERPPRKTFSKPGTFGRKREDSRERASSEGRPPRREYSPRPSNGAPRKGRPGQDRGERPAFGGSRGSGSYSLRSQGDRTGRSARSEDGGFGERKPFKPRFGDSGGAADRPRFSKGGFAGKPRAREDRGTSTESGKRVYRKFDAPRDRPARPYSADRPKREDRGDAGPRKVEGDSAPRKFGGKPPGKAGGFGGKASGKPTGFAKKSFAKSDRPFKGKPDSTFAKFAGNKKPFGKRAPGRKYKPDKGESA